MSSSTPHPFSILHNDKSIPCLRYNNHRANSPATLIFTHGASGTLSSDAIAHFSTGFATLLPLITFQGNMNLKSRVAMFEAVISGADQTPTQPPVALGGRSMGARAAVIALNSTSTENGGTRKLILASYPLHTDREVRDKILLDVGSEVEVLFIVGDGDSMCDLDRLASVRQKMEAKTWLVRVRNADHGMNVKPKKASQRVVEATGRIAAEWVKEHDMEKREMDVYWDEEAGEVRRGDWVGAGTGPKQAKSKSKTAKKDESYKEKSKPKQVKPRKTKTKETKGAKRDRSGLKSSTMDVSSGRELRSSKRAKT